MKDYIKFIPSVLCIAGAIAIAFFNPWLPPFFLTAAVVLALFYY